MISVIIPCYRAGATIERALRSVAAQTRLPAEVILVDDGSADESIVWLEALTSERRWPFAIKLVQLEANVGPGEARNAGWEEVSETSTWIAFLDADDEWLPQKLALQVGWMEAHPAYAWTAHACTWSGMADGERRLGSEGPLARRQLLWRNTVATPTVVARREIRPQFRPGWRHCEDLMLWLDWLDAGNRGARIPAELAVLGRKPVTGAGLSGDLTAMHAGELRVIAALRAEGRISAIAYFGWRIWLQLKFQRRRLRA